jgi:hypothetical protein
MEFGWFTVVKPRGSRSITRVRLTRRIFQLHTGLRPPRKPSALLAAVTTDERPHGGESGS